MRINTIEQKNDLILDHIALFFLTEYNYLKPNGLNHARVKEVY